MLNKIIIQEAIQKIKDKPWQPIDLIKVNDSIVRLALFKGDYHWHKHNDADEMFLVFQGEIDIHLKNRFI